MVKDEAEDTLKQLDDADVSDWVTIGRVLTSLENRSRTEPSGRPWQEVVKERLSKLGGTISSGKLYKIRRAYRFLEEVRPDALSLKTPPRISSVEVSERLYRLEEDAGRQALADALGPKPAPYVGLKQRYDDALAANPEMRTPRHVAWEARRRSQSTSDEEASNARAEPVSQGNIPPPEMPVPEPPDLPGQYREGLQGLLAMVWRDAWRAAERRFKAEHDELKRKIAAQAAELDVAQEEARLAHEEVQVLADKVRLLRGYDQDFDV